MESGDSGVTSPVLRVTAEISELKGNPTARSNGKLSISPSVTSKDGKNNLFTRKKVLNPLYGHNPYMRNNYAGSYASSAQNPRNNVSAFTQRVMSAKLLRTKQLQNQLAETQMKLNEVLHENKTLRTLQQRQDSALKRYEGNQEQLPQLLKSHHEEIRILNEKYKQIRANYRELESRMKQKDNELTNLREQYKHLLKLSRDKHLGEREKLTEKVEEMESIIEQQKTKIHNLDKKMQIEEKNHRHQMNQEMNKCKKIQSELNSALETINNLKATIEAKERFANVTYPRYQQSVPTNTKASHVSLPVPPRVSIRQTQRLVHSDTALQQEDSETAESFTINYSPGEPGSSSADSDNLSTPPKEENVKEKISGSSRLVGMVPGGIHISKEAFKERRALRRSAPEKEPNPAPPRDNRKGTETINRRKSLNESTRKLKDMTLRGTSINVTTVSKDDEDNIDKKVNKDDHPKEDHDLNNKERSTQENNLGAYSHLVTHEDKVFAEIESKINSEESEGKNLHLEMDDEFEKLLQGTKLSDDAISEYFKRDFRAEISEIEKKFQDLDKASERYIKLEKNMNESSFYIPVGETESDEEEIKFEQRNGETHEVVAIFSNAEKQIKSSGPMLGEAEKAYLLKALNNIDESSKPVSLETEESEEAEKISVTINDKKNSSTIPVSTFTRARRKSLVMKDLFGEEGTKL